MGFKSPLRHVDAEGLTTVRGPCLAQVLWGRTRSVQRTESRFNPRLEPATHAPPEGTGGAPPRPPGELPTSTAPATSNKAWSASHSGLPFGRRTTIAVSPDWPRCRRPPGPTPLTDTTNCPTGGHGREEPSVVQMSGVGRNGAYPMPVEAARHTFEDAWIRTSRRGRDKAPPTALTCPWPCQSPRWWPGKVLAVVSR